MSKLETNTIDTVSGTSTLQVGSTNTSTITLGVSGDTINVPSGVTIANSGTATGFGGTNTPAFMARMGSSQSITNNAEVKVQCSIEVFDTANCYDNSTNYRFTPTTAGKYLIVHGLRASLSVSRFVGWIRKNGSTDHAIAETNPNLNATAPACLGSCIIDFNGTSDYVEYYCFHTSGSAKSLEGGTNGFDATFFQGFKLIT